jgi:hypothetical protein
MVHSPLPLKYHQHYSEWEKGTNKKRPIRSFSQSVVVFSLQYFQIFGMAQDPEKLD